MPSNDAGTDAISIADLDEFARRQWEGVLGYMVGSTGLSVASEGATLSKGVKELLEFGGLVRRKKITQNGFAFILQEVNAQVWTILILYLQNAGEVRPSIPSQALSALLH